MHWLVKSLVSSGKLGSDAVTPAPGMPTSRVWELVERAAGTPEDQLVPLVAQRLRLQPADLSNPTAGPLRIIPEKLARELNVLPLRENDQKLVVASADPMDFNAEQKLGFAAGRTIEFVLAGPRALERALRSAYPPEAALEALLSGRDQLLDAVSIVQEQKHEDISARDLEAAPVVKLTNMILSDAIRDRASDIHIEPVGTSGVVRVRVDGVMRMSMQLPLQALGRVISRIKILSNLDIADRVRPQDGRTRVRIGDREYDLRVSTVPLQGGEKAVIRVLAQGHDIRLGQLGLPPHELARVQKLLGQRDGIVAVTGPTGSGKTTTLYAALRELTDGTLNIVTVEDPVEYRIAGISQIQVEPRRGVTFASALRAVLRQDPDVILLGEMRDTETAGIAVQAAMTGHLVLGTLHANDAVGSVARLVDLGVERASLADSLRGALAQRLVRKLCSRCSAPVGDTLLPDEQRLAAKYGVKPLRRPVGCDVCAQSGYYGRLPVVEVMIVTPEIQQLIARGASSAELQRAALTGGMRPLQVVGLDSVKSGDTTLHEIERVLGEMSEETAAALAVAEEPTGPHILMADDDEVVRMVAREILEDAGYKVSEVENGRQALERLRTGAYSLLISDLDMPEVDGLTLLKRLRANASSAALPIIVLTGSESAEPAVMEAGADDYIRKPIEPARFIARVKAVLRRASI